MPANNPSQSFTFLGFLVREGTARIFAGVIWYAIWGGYQPDLSDHQLEIRILTRTRRGATWFIRAAAPL
jgi:hypothetical protein